MKFLLSLLFVATLAVAVKAQTESAAEIISDIEDLISSPGTDYYSYSSYYDTPSYYDYYTYTDEVTTTKPFKQQFLSLLFNKNKG